MLMPKRVKRRRVFRGRMKGKAMRGNFLAYGDFVLVATEPSWITSQQIEAARIALTRYTKRGGQVWIKIFPDKPVTEKPAETRMGSGKGSPEYWVAVVKPGRVLFEIAGVPEESAREALRLFQNRVAHFLRLPALAAGAQNRDARQLVKAAAKARIDESLVVKALVERRRIAEQHVARHLADERLAQKVTLVRLALKAD